MRITGGIARGISLKCPSRGTRPSTDAMREALYSSLGDWVQGIRVLDLFAGTGAYGFEALSRGAEYLCSIEMNGNAVKCIKENAASVTKAAGVNAPFKIDIRKMDVSRILRSNEKYDFVIIDPPYEDIASFVERYGSHLHKLLNDAQSRLAFEMPANMEFTNIDELNLIKRIGKKKSSQPNICLYSLSLE